MAVTAEYATGKRKNSIARAWLSPGSGEITVNSRTFDHYFPTSWVRASIQSPLDAAGVNGQYNVKATIRGGGTIGQAGALRHAIARALVALNPALREQLKKEGYLTRDARVKERKKYGQKGARKRFQYSKR